MYQSKVQYYNSCFNLINFKLVGYYVVVGEKQKICMFVKFQPYNYADS